MVTPYQGVYMGLYIEGVEPRVGKAYLLLVVPSDDAIMLYYNISGYHIMTL